MIRALGHVHLRVGGPQSDRLFTLLQRHGFRVHRVGPGELQVEKCTVDEVDCFAHFFHVPLLDVSRVEQGRSADDEATVSPSAASLA